MSARLFKGAKIHGLTVSAGDQLNPERTFDVKKPKTLCAPVEVDAGSILNHLLCYEIKLVPGLCADTSPKNTGGVCKKEKDCGGKDGKGKKGKKGTSFCEKQPKDRKVEAFLNNDFGPSLVEVKKVKELCVPSEKTVL